MIGGKDDDSIFECIDFLERIEQHANLCVEIADHSVVSMARGANVRIRDMVFVLANQLEVALAPGVTLLKGNEGHRWHVNFCIRVEIPVFL